MKKKIDVIMPVFNTPSSLMLRSLSSIAMQTIVKDIQLIIIDDCSSDQDFMKEIKLFSKIIDIDYYRLSKNIGPGQARQYGIDHSVNEYIVFLDADDCFYNTFSIENLLKGIENENNIQICYGEFIKYDSNNNFYCKYSKRDGWLFAKIYRRQFIQQNKICFHPTSRANEDGGFNLSCQFCLQSDEEVKYIDQVVYCWCSNNINSITLKNNEEYICSTKENHEIKGMIENVKYAILNHFHISRIDLISEVAYFTLIQLYLYYLTIKAIKSDEANNLLIIASDYFKFFANLSLSLESEDYVKIYQEALEGYSYHTLPDISFLDFLTLISG